MKKFKELFKNKRTLWIIIGVCICCVAVVALITNQTAKTNTSNIKSGSVICKYDDHNINSKLSQDDLKTIAKIFNNKELHYDSPSCGFDVNVAVILDGKHYCIANDSCGVVYLAETNKYFVLSDKENTTVRRILNSYGFKSPYYQYTGTALPEEDTIEFFTSNEIIFDRVATALYDNIRNYTSFSIKNNELIATNSNGKRIKIEKLQLTKDTQSDIVTCLNLMDEFFKDKTHNYSVGITKREYGSVNKVLDFSINDLDIRVDYCFMYSKENIADRTKLKDNWYLCIDGLV